MPKVYEGSLLAQGKRFGIVVDISAHGCAADLDDVCDVGFLRRDCCV